MSQTQTAEAEAEAEAKAKKQRNIYKWSIRARHAYQKDLKEVLLAT